MSIRIENRCVGCGLSCLGNRCSYRYVRVVYCDICGCEGAEYHLDGDDLCKSCAESKVDEALKYLTLFERANAAGLELKFNG